MPPEEPREALDVLEGRGRVPPRRPQDVQDVQEGRWTSPQSPGARRSRARTCTWDVDAAWDLTHGGVCHTLNGVPPRPPPAALPSRSGRAAPQARSEPCGGAGAGGLAAGRGAARAAPQRSATLGRTHASSGSYTVTLPVLSALRVRDIPNMCTHLRVYRPTPRGHMTTVAIISQKGGSGKSTLALHLAVASSQERDTAVIDLDPQASAASWADHREAGTPPVLSAHSSRLPFVMKEVEQAEGPQGSLVILDTAPHADRVALDAAKVADLVLIPARTTIFDIEPCLRTCELIATMKTPQAAWRTPAHSWSVKSPRSFARTTRPRRRPTLYTPSCVHTCTLLERRHEPMAGKPSFEEALSKRKPANEEPKGPKRSRGGTSTLKPSRTGTKHIGGHFPPEVAKQLRQLAVDEDTSHQKLLGEALDLLFQSRRLPTIASK